LMFVKKVGGFGPRVLPIEKLILRLSNMKSHSNVDTLPESVFETVLESMKQRGVSPRAMAEKRGVSFGGVTAYQFSPSRKLISEYAEVLADEALAAWARSKVFWDRVISVERAGQEETFDLTVPNYHNWLADGVATHNSGAIEQDADMILLIYRDEVYNKDTPKKGVADIDLAKHRNGETGDIRLTFRGANSRFENYADPAYGEGIMR